MSKSASEREVAIGDVLAYTVLVSYVGSGTIGETVLTDELPVGFRLLERSVFTDGIAVALSDHGNDLLVVALQPEPRYRVAVRLVGDLIKDVRPVGVALGDRREERLGQL